MKGNCTPTADVPNLRCLVYDIAVAATACKVTQAHSVRGGHKMPLHGGATVCRAYYSVSQKKTSPTFLAVTRESIVGFS